MLGPSPSNLSNVDPLPQRHPAKHAAHVSRREKVAEEYINYIAATATPIALTLSAVAEETARDETLQAVMEALQTA